MEGKVFIRGNWLNRYGRKKGGGEPVEGLVVLAKKCADKSTGGQLCSLLESFESNRVQGDV